MNAYKIITKADGKFGVQRIGSQQVNGSFASLAEEAEAIGLSQGADKSGVCDAEQY